MPRGHTDIWKHFKKCPDKLAECNLCKNLYSYKTTSTNLKQHLKFKHESAYIELMQVSKNLRPSNRGINASESVVGGQEIWNYFDRNDDTKRAKCHNCYKSLIYKNNTNYMKTHLKLKHNALFLELEKALREADGGDEPTPRKRKSRRPSSGSDSNSTFEYENNGNGDSDTDSPPDVWTYFEKESMDRARCVICRQTLGRNTASLTDHMKEKHAKLAVDIHAYDQNSYTEYVYLEDQDPIQPQQPEIRVQKPPERKPVVLEYYSPPEKKTTHTQDSHTQETRSEDGIDLFGKYVTNLLRDFPKDACIKVQGDIISLIIAEKLKIADPTPTQNGRSSIAPVILAVASEHLMPVPSSSNEQTIDNVATDKVPCIP